MKKVYLISPKIKWSVFKMLQDKLVKDSGPVPVNFDKVLWKMLRDKQIVCWFADDIEKNNMGIAITLPVKYKNYEINLISNYK